MTDTRHEARRDIVRQFTWALTRRHRWGTAVEFERAVDDTFQDSRVGVAETVLRPLLKQHRIRFFGWSESPVEVVKLRVDGGRRVELAYFLRDEVGVPAFAVETKLSRFERVDGGFDGTTEPQVTYVDWPE